MSSVDELVASTQALLTQADNEAGRLGNQGRSADRYTQKASITATLAVATAIQGQQAAAVQNAQAMADARAQLAEVVARVAKLEVRRQTLATVVVNVPVLAVGARDLTVTWPKSLGDANYQVTLTVDDVLLGKATATLKSSDALAAVITVRATVGVLQATTVTAEAWRGV